MKKVRVRKGRKKEIRRRVFDLVSRIQDAKRKKFARRKRILDAGFWIILFGMIFGGAAGISIGINWIIDLIVWR